MITSMIAGSVFVISLLGILCLFISMSIVFKFQMPWVCVGAFGTIGVLFMIVLVAVARY